MTQDFPTYSQNIIGRNSLSIVIATLVNDSQWFEVMPLPDDHYMVKVREENKGLLQRIALLAVDVVPLVKDTKGS